MTLDPLTAAAPAVQLHVAAVVVAIAFTPVQWLARRGGRVHRVSGRIWIATMVVVALSSMFIHQLRLWGPFSPIHLLSAGTLVGLAYALGQARRGNIRAHRRAMTIIVAGALVGAGVFTLAPGRILHAVLSGP
ncbi:membrane protein [Alsobacter metallidurans]|uniref:Membrane protein n=2 Tax=Alsobacter metallidurans TaxID=340221 RepID=A0A917I857_9HYPH|nr:membrane protein [Alsobacter metallidurans]